MLADNREGLYSCRNESCTEQHAIRIVQTNRVRHRSQRLNLVKPDDTEAVKRRNRNDIITSKQTGKKTSRIKRHAIVRNPYDHQTAKRWASALKPLCPGYLADYFSCTLRA